MGDPRVLVTAAELDEFTPDQRAAAMRERIVTDLADVPEHFRRQITETASALAAVLPPRE
jgi:hypothetical protein